MDERSMKAYEEILELCKAIIETDFKPCGLDQEIKKQLLDLVLEWEKKCNVPFTSAVGAFNSVYRMEREAAKLSGGDYGGDQQRKCYYLRIKLEKRELQSWFWRFHNRSEKEKFSQESIPTV
jgi:hypothetical protein